MGLTILLARFFGIYLTVMGLAVVKNHKRVEAAAGELSDSNFGQLIAGVIPLLFGAFLVNIHNFWGVNGLVCSVSLMCWLFLVSGMFRLIFTEQWITLVKNFKDLFVRPAGFVCFLVGVAFLYFGFFT